MRVTSFTPVVRGILLVISTALPGGRVLAGDCPYDQVHQTKVVEAIAKAIPGGTTDDARRQLTWTDPSVGTTTFGFGGCADFGSRVTRSTPTDAPRTREQVFAVARELATRYWDNDIVAARAASRALVSGLASGMFIVQADEHGEMILVQEPGYIQIYLQHGYENGTDRVTIGWQAAF
jgi:hypothetical protein